MNDLNKVELIGRLTADPELRSSGEKSWFVTMRVATNCYPGKSDDGKAERDAEFHTVVAYGKLARIAGKYLRRGDRLYLDGRLHTYDRVSKDNRRTRYVEIVAQNLIMLGGASRPGRNDKVIVKEIETGNDGED